MQACLHITESYLLLFPSDLLAHHGQVTSPSVVSLWRGAGPPSPVFLSLRCLCLSRAVSLARSLSLYLSLPFSLRERESASEGERQTDRERARERRRRARKRGGRVSVAHRQVGAQTFPKSCLIPPNSETREGGAFSTLRGFSERQSYLPLVPSDLLAHHGQVFLSSLQGYLAHKRMPPPGTLQ